MLVPDSLVWGMINLLLCAINISVDKDLVQHGFKKSSYVKATISDLLQNKIDMSKLVITKALSKRKDVSSW
jgi:hypothetical protein